MTITIYTRSSPPCPYCVRAETLLINLGYTFEKKDIVVPETKAELQSRYPEARTIPQVFVGETRIGGCDDLTLAISTGEFDAIVTEDR